MKSHKTQKVFALLLLLILLLPFAAQAEGNTLFECVTGGRTIDEWFISDVVPNAGKGAEWYIFALKMSGYEPDGKQYLASLDAYLKENTLGAVASQRCALAALSLGKSDRDTVDLTAGKGGIMSYVFALHLLNNGATSKEHTVSSLTNTLLSMQNEDGGWSLNGTRSDVDVTAMTLQALAANKNGIDKSKIDKAVDFLASSRCDDGGFKSYGTENCESTAMVIIALAALDIDDARFDGVDDVLERYAVDGGYSHTEGGAKNSIATVQALCAKAARICRRNGNMPFVFKKSVIVDTSDDASCDTSDDTSSEISNDASDYESNDTPDNVSSDISNIISNDFSNDASSGTSNDSSSFISSETSDLDPDITSDLSKNENGKRESMDLKSVLCIIILCIGAVSVVIFIIKKQRKNIFIAIAVTVALVAAVLILNIQTPDEHFKTESAEYQYSVTFAIYCDAIEADPVPYDGTVIAECTVGFDEGENVCDVLKRAAKQNNIAVDGTDYVRAIGNLCEMQYGAMSGWVYSVNGVYPNVPCTEYILADGDTVVWRYTTGGMFDE